MVSYIISVRGCDARISAATLIVYSGLSRSSIRSDIGASASTGTADLSVAWTESASSESPDHHESSLVACTLNGARDRAIAPQALRGETGLDFRRLEL